MKSIFLIFVFYFGYCSGHGVSLENSIVGDPLVECGADSIFVAFRTERPFQGRLYVEGESEKPECSKKARESTSTGPNADFR